jgi:hypothetical protein
MFGLLSNLQALNPAIVNFDYYLPLTLCDLWIENVFKVDVISLFAAH